jgi:LCP family protein required for cell wall assembly
VAQDAHARGFEGAGDREQPPSPDEQGDPDAEAGGDAGRDADEARAAAGFESLLEQAQSTEEFVEQVQRRERAARRAKRRRRIKYALLATTVTASLAVSAGFVYLAYDVQHLTRNLKHTALLPPGVSEPPELVDAFGRSAINLLLLGSDTRDTSADCALGGACVQGSANSGANGDSEMIVHLSADRSNATVVSIPRDTETELPACAGGGRGMINSALQYGADCQVAAVVKLTGLTIDHFIEFDFAGVVDLSSELGGVPVCVSAAVHDPYSGLTIGAGVTEVQGRQALQFLRTRHAFYDGSDLGREQATHIFMSALLRKVKQDATLTNIGEMQSLAETVTRYTTVDNGLDSVTALLELATDFGEVPADRVTFLTMPWDQDTDTSDPGYQARVVEDQAATALFADIRNDRSFTASGDGSGSFTAAPSATPQSSGSPSAGPSASPSAPTAQQLAAASASAAAAKESESAAARTHPMQVQVINSSGGTDRYQTVVARIFQDGFVYSSGSDATSTVVSTTLVYSAQEAKAAQELAADLDLPPSALLETGTGTRLVLTIGSDWPSGSTYPAAAADSASAAISVPSQSFEENGADSSACVQANPGDETH